MSTKLSVTEKISVTECMNANSKDLDSLTSLEIATLMNREDSTIAAAIIPSLPCISRAIEYIAQTFRNGGRLIYVGAGSSGRLGVLDASECVPTFSASVNQVVGIVAGGDKALRSPIEGIEDDWQAGEQDLIDIALTARDIVCGISASGSAAYVNQALRYAKKLGCFTIFVGCNDQATIGQEVDCFIVAEVGPEVLTGSTRLKSGTATKMILNMLTTGAFILCGKVYKNLMIDVKPVNKKMVKRCYRIISTICGIDEISAAELFYRGNGCVKTAILMHMLGVDCQQAQACLAENKGLLKDAINSIHTV